VIEDKEKAKCQATFADANVVTIKATMRENDFRLRDCHNFLRNAHKEERISLAKSFLVEETKAGYVTKKWF